MRLWRLMNLFFADYAEYYEATGRRLDISNWKLPSVMTDVDFFAGYASGQITWNHNSIIDRRSPAVKIGFYWDPATTGSLSCA